MKLDCIITGGGRLVEKNGRAGQDKGAELIAGITTGERVLDIIQKGAHIDTIVYAGIFPSQESKKTDRVTFTQAGPEKHFFGTIKHGVEKLNGSGNQILVVASDLPLIDEKSVNEMIQEWQRAGGTMLTAFSCSNEQIQRKYPGYNPNKRFIQMQDDTMIFGNAFIMSRELFEMLEKLFLEIDSSEKRNLGTYLGFYRMLGIKGICKLLSILAHTNIKNTKTISKLLRKIFSPPFQRNFEGLADHMLRKTDSIKILKCAPEFTIDFDRYHQRRFFEETITNNS